MSAVRFQTHGVFNYNCYIRQLEFLEKEEKEKEQTHLWRHQVI